MRTLITTYKVHSMQSLICSLLTGLEVHKNGKRAIPKELTHTITNDVNSRFVFIMSWYLRQYITEMNLSTVIADVDNTDAM